AESLPPPRTTRRSSGSGVAWPGVAAIDRQKAACRSRRAGPAMVDIHASYTWRLPGQHLVLDRAGAVRLRKHLLELRNAIVPLDQRRDRPEARDRVPVERPDGWNDRRVVGVEEMRAVIGVAREVDLADARGGERVDVDLGREAVVHRTDVDIVHV